LTGNALKGSVGDVGKSNSWSCFARAAVRISEIPVVDTAAEPDPDPEADPDLDPPPRPPPSGYPQSPPRVRQFVLFGVDAVNFYFL